MDFAKKQLEKYGWTEGRGLGKHEDGISAPLKPKLKFDNSGVGHQMGKDFTNKWWENVYNNASNNLAVNKDDDDDEVKMSTVNEESVEITTKDYSIRDLKKKNNGLQYGTFLKTSKLTQDGLVQFENVVKPEQAALPKVQQLTDEELFAACGGRTAHKGARHGLKLSGKLSRIEKQEKLLLKQLQKVSLSDTSDAKIEKKIKKIKKQNGIKAENKDESSVDSSTKKKKRKKKRKSVSFSETVTEYHTQDLDTSSQSNESYESPVAVLISKMKDKIEENNDEGIEQDCETKTNDLGGHQSFEEVQKSKKLKKKKTRATERFLQLVDYGVNIDINDDINETIKRKHDDDLEDIEEISCKKRCEKHQTHYKKKKKKRISNKDESKINSIAASLNQVCKISDTE